jgi:hypothetical protein
MKDIRQTFKEKIFECNKHAQKIEVAQKHLSNFIPLNVQSYQNMSEIDTSFVDQLIYRFSKLQDTLGEKIFPSILILAHEDVKKKTFIDILNRLEELEVVDRNEWLKLREMRNEIAHEYSFNLEEVVDSIVSIYTISSQLLAIYRKTVVFCEEKFELAL